MYTRANKTLNLRALFIVSLCTLFSLLVNSFAEELKTKPREVVLTGKLVTEKFMDFAFEKQVEAYILTLDTPIDVAGDEIGSPVKNVKKIQLAFHETSFEEVDKKYLNKRVKLTGSLFHAISGHHYTKVLMWVETIIVINGN